MQVQINALKEHQFKAPVSFQYPTNGVDNNGNTKYATICFVCIFRPMTDDERSEYKAEISNVQYQIDNNEMTLADGEDALKAMIEEQVMSFWVATEKHPKQVYPFMDGDRQADDTPEVRKQLLENMLHLRKAVSAAYWDEVNKDVVKKLKGNSRK